MSNADKIVGPPVPEGASGGQPIEAVFIEQAEYISEPDFLAWSAEHPNEDSIIRRLSLGGAKLLVGPRGSGKTTLMLKAYYNMLRDPDPAALPIYVNFKLSLRLEPFYANTPNATFWFQKWLILKIYEGAHEAIGKIAGAAGTLLPRRDDVRHLVAALEEGRTEAAWDEIDLTVDGLAENLRKCFLALRRTRCILLLDDAAHAFSPKQQEDFFDFFRQIKSRDISPKAAIYPGITTSSPNFHVGHDAEQIDVWIRPDASSYLAFMRSLAARRFGGRLPEAFSNNTEDLDFLAYAAFGIPRSFLNMIRSLYQDDDTGSKSSTIDRRKLLAAAKQSRESAHNVYESLVFKLPAYREFVKSGESVYTRLIGNIKEFNGGRPDNDQAVEVGIKRPVSPELTKVFSFFQYAGLLMPTGENSRGVKGVFDTYMVHFGDLITENAVIGRRSKSASSFVGAFKAQTHQAWPRISPERLVRPEKYTEAFPLTLPHCQKCGAERANEHAKFCQNCGAKLKTASVYEELVAQDISVLPITKTRAARIKEEANLRTIKDILIDTSRERLRSVHYIGPFWAERIARYAEEHVA